MLDLCKAAIVAFFLVSATLFAYRLGFDTGTYTQQVPTINACGASNAN
jgi:hypothetical protein